MFGLFSTITEVRTHCTDVHFIWQDDNNFSFNWQQGQLVLLPIFLVGIIVILSFGETIRSKATDKANWPVSSSGVVLIVARFKTYCIVVTRICAQNGKNSCRRPDRIKGPTKAPQRKKVNRGHSPSTLFGSYRLLKVYRRVSETVAARTRPSARRTNGSRPSLRLRPRSFEESAARPCLCVRTPASSSARTFDRFGRVSLCIRVRPSARDRTPT